MPSSPVGRIKAANASIKGYFYLLPRRIAKYFVNGLVMIIPLAVTIWVVAWLFNTVDGLLAPILTWGFGRHMPGLGVVIIVVATLLIGYFGVKVGHRRVFGLIESTFIKIPVAGAIYDGVRQIVRSFSGKTDKQFLEVVFMEFPRQGIYTVGFVTGETTVRGEKMLNVFIPTAPTPFGGFLQIVPAAQVIRSRISVNDAMKLVISAGGFSPGEVGEIIRQTPETGGVMPGGNLNPERE